MRKYPALHRALIAVLIDLRKESGLSQKALSLKLKQVSTYINEIENFEHGVSFTEFVGIVEALDADPVEVLQTVLKSR